MKNVLFSTDLTKNACNIALYAAELCRHVGARLIIFHAYETTRLNDQNTESYNLERTIQAKMDTLTRKLKLVPGLSITRLLKPNLAEDETLYIARKVKANLVILSTGSLDTASATIKGNSTLHALTHARIPTFVVPPKANYKPYSRIALFEEKGEQPVSFLEINFLRYLSDTTKVNQLIKHLHAEKSMALAAVGAAEQALHPAMSEGTAVPALPIINGALVNIASFVKACRPDIMVLLVPTSESGSLINSRIKSLHTKFVPILLIPSAEE